MAGRDRVALRPLLQQWLERLGHAEKQWRRFQGTQLGSFWEGNASGIERCRIDLVDALGGVGAGRIAEARETEQKNDDDQARVDSQ